MCGGGSDAGGGGGVDKVSGMVGFSLVVCFFGLGSFVEIRETERQRESRRW